MNVTVALLTREVLPEIFRSPDAIGEYGRLPSSAQAMAELSELLEASPVAKLAGKVREIVSKLKDADPRRISKPPSWLDKLTGKPVENHVLYQEARGGLERLLEDAETLAQSVRDALASMAHLAIAHASEAEHLAVHIDAGRQFLQEHPDAGRPVEGSVTFDNPRERFERKLVNLATLLASHEMSVAQLKLTRAQAVHMLDRYDETARVLVPVWRQHSLALISGNGASAQLVAEATRAHRALVESLSHASMNS